MKNQEQYGLPREIKLSLVFVGNLIVLMGHKQFMTPTKPREIDHWPDSAKSMVNNFYHWAVSFHHLFHSIMGILIPIILLVLTGRVCWLLFKSWKE